MPVLESACGNASVLNCGFVRDRGTERTSTSRSTPASRNSATSSATDRVECPIVKIVCTVRPSAPGSLRLTSRGNIVVDLLGAQRRRTREEPGDVTFEGGALLNRAELQTERDMRPDIDVGGGEAVADQVLAPRHGIFECVHRSEEHTSELQSRVDISYAVF